MVMVNSIGTYLSTVIEWCGTVINALIGDSGALSELQPLIIVGISISALMLGVKVIKTFAWGT